MQFARKTFFGGLTLILAFGLAVAGDTRMKYPETKKTDLALTKKQICINEKLYKCMNSFISRINSNPEKARQLDKKCNKRIHSILESANTFQRDRFNYEVNNAYLVKNQYYSKNYFLLKKILRKQKSIKGLLEIMKHLPERVEDCVIYLKKYT